MSAPSDNRWSKRESYSPGWEERTRIMASMINPGESVLDIGCGLLTLQRHLPPGCHYTPADQTDHFGAMIIFDLNSGNFPAIEPHDVAFLGGVLEYVQDVPGLIKNLSAVVKSFVLSYAVVWDHTTMNIDWRRSNGWVNDYTTEGIQNVMQNAGCHLAIKELWHGQILFRFDVEKK